VIHVDLARSVLVLGRDPGSVDAAAWIDAAAERNQPLVLLSFGYPVSADQGGLVSALIDEAFDRGVHFEAVLVAARSDLSAQLRPGDDITVLSSSGRERRTIEAPSHRGPVIARPEPQCHRALVGRSLRAITWTSICDAARTRRLTKEPRISSCHLDRSGSPTTSCVTCCR
jgi:hypothetical protein